MNLRQIEILRAIIRYNTTVAAAKTLGLSQPAISNAIKTMEDQAGFVLFQRVNNRLYPTPEARLLAEDAEAIFEMHERLLNRIRDLRDSRAGRLRLVATPPLGYSVVVTAIRELQAQRPKIRTYFDVRRYEGVVSGVETNHAELGFILGFREQPGLASEVLFEGKMVCVMRPDHPLARKKVVEPGDLLAHRFIALERGTRLGEAIRDAFERADVPFDFATEVRYGNSACALAEADAGVAIVDPLTARGGRYDLVSRPFLPDIPVTASAIWAENRELSRLARFFLDRMRDVFTRIAPIEEPG
ncbi:LysR family transcriptional regulator [Acetobacter nitrogenifigens DSM 23921 = NBRC 105050]|uniref:Transcriptional regulator n=1 Tax=Acetobacter nitrogenifigens DSM 23921 = NBRC 105050 TaxID=1120919 RepID=A0A511X8N6_9PROT|nr:LysR family transcriptional regulator [Acetobacter nitrogenifigens]GBQ87585.1 LysR family transcriptional regulator [Acetobacter nitrogenifigens DSM 23921 = NBRC 105050]GEN59310.1 transcriptional regulator [Acetobacter nitrogenifigens DSM 23921 = NBRC 105050]